MEVKSFISRSAVSDFHTALGECINYQFALEEVEPDRKLYLAIPDAIYHSFFQRRFIQSVIQRTQLKLFTYDEIQEVVCQWL